MLRGLEGRRIAVLASGNAEREVAAVTQALEAAGARLQLLKPGEGAGSEADWHGARYAGLVVISESPVTEPKVLQLAREFFVSQKPVAAFGAGAAKLAQSGGTEDALTAAAGTEIEEFARRIVSEFSSRLEE